MKAPLDGVRVVASDLDGVVYRGEDAIESAVEALNSLPAEVELLLATNNASRTPASVADHLRALGLDVAEEDVVTSAMAGAHVLARTLGEDGRGAAVLAVGGPGVAAALEAEGFRVVTKTDPDDPPAAVLQGYGPDTPWSAFAEASYAIAAGAVWCLTNEDRTIPTARGLAPGNGMGGAAVRAATGAEPLVAGKPETPIYELALSRRGAEPSTGLALGDRLDTDILGANRVGMQSVFVPTGVHDLPDLAAAHREQRPTYLLADLSGLTEPYLAPTVEDDVASCGSATAGWSDGPHVAGGTREQQARALVALTWHRLDTGAADPEAARAVPRWRDLPGGDA